MPCVGKLGLILTYSVTNLNLTSGLRKVVGNNSLKGHFFSIINRSGTFQMNWYQERNEKSMGVGLVAFKCVLFMFPSHGSEGQWGSCYSPTFSSTPITTGLDLASLVSFSFSFLESIAESVHSLLFCIIWVGKQLTASGAILFSMNWLETHCLLGVDFSCTAETNPFRLISLQTRILFHCVFLVLMLMPSLMSLFFPIIFCR